MRPGRLDDPAQVLARLERADREHVVPLGGRPFGVKCASTAFPITATRSAGTPSSSTASRFVNSETARTRSAARATRAIPAPAGVRCHRGKSSGWRTSARSCSVTVNGTGDRSGPRKVVQWRTSSPRAERGRPP